MSASNKTGGKETGEGAFSQEKLRGVFSLETSSYIGYGDTRRKVKNRVLVFVEEEDQDTFLLKALNEEYYPVGEGERIGREQLLNDYLPEPTVYHEKVYPLIRKVVKTIAKADRHRRLGETYSAEYEYKNALRIDEENIRATFGLGLTYLDRGDAKRGDLVFRRLASLKADFAGEHKHLFNEFGIALRKNRMYSQALKYYARAYKLSPRDDHLLYNLSRTLYEKGKIKAAHSVLLKALALNPELEEGRQFLDFINRKEEKRQKTMRGAKTYFPTSRIGKPL